MNLKVLMMLVLSVSLVIGVVWSNGCSSNEGEKKTTEIPSQEPPPALELIKNITPSEFNTLIEENKNNPDFIILDVRTPEEYAAGHIENSVMIDFRADTFRKEIDQLDKSKDYLIYCRSGNRSYNAAAMMVELEFESVYNMLDGIIRWRAEGLPLVQ